MPNYYDFRCTQCNKLLGKVEGNTEILCPRCGGINELDIKTKEIKYTSKLRKANDRASSSGELGSVSFYNIAVKRIASDLTASFESR